MFYAMLIGNAKNETTIVISEICYPILECAMDAIESLMLSMLNADIDKMYWNGTLHT